MGMKQTEIGEIPEDWDVSSYGDIFKFLSTSTNPRSDLSENGELLYLHYGDIHTKLSNHVNVNSFNFPNIDENLVSSALIEDGDLVMADTSEDYHGISKSVEIRNPNNIKMVAGLHTFLLRDFGKRLSAGYRGYLHNTPIVKQQFNRLATGLKVYGVSKNNLKKVIFPVPSKEEQNKIVNVLTDTENLIQATEQLINKKQQIKTATMQNLLTGKIRLAEFDTKQTKSSELGEIPSDWKIDVIKNVALITTGDKNTQDKIETGVYPFFVRSQTIEQINSYSFDGEGVLTAGDGVGTGKIFHYINGKFDFHQRVYLIHSFSDKLDGFYFYIYFSNNFYDRIMSMTAKSSVDSVRREMIADMKIVLPSKLEQKAIAEILSDMDKKITALNQRLTKLNDIKQGLMQNLLTGKIRLTE